MRVLTGSVLLSCVLLIGLAPRAMALTVRAGAPRERPALSHGAGGGGYVPTPTSHPRKHKQKKHAPYLVSLKIAAGYAESYREGTWVPVRITAHNRTPNTISGTLEAPDASTSGNNQGPPQGFRALYQVPVVLPGGATKQVTLYLPASSVNGEVDIQLRSSDGVIGASIDSPTTFDRQSISVGALTADPLSISWIKHISPQTGTVSLVRLTPGTVDPLAEALANFDIIVLSDGSVSRLDHDQLSALRQYVVNGGTLVLIGGPGWQGTLSPLPADLIPGRLTGTTVLPNLLGLQAVQHVSPPKHENPTSVSVLHNPQGTVLASQAGVPLAVRDPLGGGRILYLAFDPSLDPIAGYPLGGSGATDVLTQLLLGSAPAAAGRAALPQGAPAPSLFFNPFGPPSNIGAELDNVPAAALPSILLFGILTLLYILLLGPVNFLILRRIRRRGLMWITLPVGALACMGCTFGVAYHLKGSTVLVNSVGVVTLDGTQGAHPAALYLGLFAPVRGDYNLTLDGAALPQYVPNLYGYYGPGPTQSSGNPLALRFQEGSQTGIQFLGMNMWSMRNAALHTTVNIPGTVRSQLHIDHNGYIVGAVHNDTPLTLVHPSIVAGRAVIRLPDMPPEKTIPVRIKPRLDIYNYSAPPLWTSLYGQFQFGYGGPVFMSQGPCIGCSGGPVRIFQKSCCYGPTLPPEHTFTDRLRNTVTQIPEAQNVSSLGEVLFIAWNQQPLGSISVDGTSPQRRDLNLIMSPLTVGLNSGPFVLRTGTIGARMVDLAPQSGSNRCCFPPTTIDLGSGGWANFEFDLPHASRIHFNHLWLYVNAGGADGTGIGRVWDWHAGRWVKVNLANGYVLLRNPDRFLSARGSLLLKLVADDFSADIRIGDIHSDLQIAGDGVATADQARAQGAR